VSFSETLKVGFPAELGLELHNCDIKGECTCKMPVLEDDCIKIKDRVSWIWQLDLALLNEGQGFEYGECPSKVHWD
jgi:hypothetical protein